MYECEKYEILFGTCATTYLSLALQGTGHTGIEITRYNGGWQSYIYNKYRLESQVSSRGFRAEYSGAIFSCMWLAASCAIGDRRSRTVGLGWKPTLSKLPRPVWSPTGLPRNWWATVGYWLLTGLWSGLGPSPGGVGP